MSRLRLARAAFKNMMRAAARDPLWAVLALLAMPFRIWKLNRAEFAGDPNS
ncbi:hypothetical protein [Agrobacterium pusense]|uniref:Uncharacterized protein n=1 Tax=Agrobacterium pusense TaxID=648995 RepID=A0AA44EHS6_9HYPH|nr:hypothetical protein [Agrobacterium pusense]NRF10342.1 hypothetical protein [Agrobacterium pusense]NRF18753.1 hypothetical protein [Agrobacterium pusense]